MHSDWVIGYFANYYNVSNHVSDPFYADVPHARIEPYKGSEIYGGYVRQYSGLCGTSFGSKCNNEATEICHYATPEWMKKETDRLRLNTPQYYRKLA